MIKQSDNSWKRFQLIEILITVSFIINLLFGIVNSIFLKLAVPNELQLFSFAITLGLYLGFAVCKREYYNAKNKEK